MKKTYTLTLYSEQWLLKRLQDHGAPRLDAGVTTDEERRERIRQAIIDYGLTQVIVGRSKEGKALLWPEAFTALYGVPFETDRSVAA